MPENIENDQEKKHIATALVATHKLLETVILQSQENSHLFGEWKMSIEQMKEQMKEVLYIVRDAGDESLVGKSLTRGQNLKSLTEELKELKVAVKDLSVENTKGSWNVKLAIINGIFAVMGGSIAALLTLYLRS